MFESIRIGVEVCDARIEPREFLSEIFELFPALVESGFFKGELRR